MTIIYVAEVKKKRDPTQSYDMNPFMERTKQQQKDAPKRFVIHNEWGQTAVTTSTQLVWLTRLR